MATWWKVGYPMHDGSEADAQPVAPDAWQAGLNAGWHEPDGVSFGVALDMLLAGLKVRRRGWNGRGMFLFLVPGSTFKVNRPPLLGIYPPGTVVDYQPHIDMVTAQGTVVPWLASQTDILATDWEAA